MLLIQRCATNPTEQPFPRCSLALWTTCVLVYIWVQRARTERYGAGSGCFLHHQHSCIGCGRDASQQFLQHKELRWPCSWLLLILLLESAALRGLQPHFYWKSCAVMKPFSLWLGYCSHKSSYWPLGSSHMFVLLQCYVWTFVYWQSGSPITALMLKSFTYNFFKVRSAFSLFFFYCYYCISYLTVSLFHQCLSAWRNSTQTKRNPRNNQGWL